MLFSFFYINISAKIVCVFCRKVMEKNCARRKPKKSRALDMGRGSAGARLLGMGRGSAGARLRGMGRGNDAKTALGVIKETK